MNELAEKLMTYRIDSSEWQVLMMFFRFCYGYQNSTCDLTWKDMKEFTQLSDGTLSKVISKLKSRNILLTFQQESKTTITYKINSKLSSWKPSLSHRKVIPTGKRMHSHRKVNAFPQESIPIKDNIKTKDSVPYQEIIKYLNQKSGKNFKATSKETRRHIKARFNEGFSLDDFKRVIDMKCAAWLPDPRMLEYLRPQTLFGTKFESYLNSCPEKIIPENDKLAEYKRIMEL